MRRKWMVIVLAVVFAAFLGAAVTGCGSAKKKKRRKKTVEAPPPCPYCGKADKVTPIKYGTMNTRADLDLRSAHKLKLGGMWYSGAPKWFCWNPACKDKQDNKGFGVSDRP